MKKFLIALFMGMMAVAAQAAPQQSDLTPEQQAQVNAWKAENKDPTKQVVSKSSELRAEASQWGEMIGDALSAGASKLNVAANEFGQTTIGKVTIAVVVYKVMGKDIIRFFAGFLVWITTLFAGWYIMRGWRAKVIPDSHTEELFPVLWGMFHVLRKTNIQYRTIREDGDRASYMISGLIVLALGTVIAAMIAFV